MSPYPDKAVTVGVDALQDDTAGQRRRILLLDDRDDFGAVLSEHLALRGFEVTAVRSGIEGLHEIRQRGFDLILSDMIMPRMGGEMFYWAVTRMRPAAAQRFIFFTGHRNKSDLDFFFRRINATVLIKPFALSVLDATIRQVLRQVG